VSPPALGGLGGSRILVTGGSGFIGRHVVTELTTAGAHVRVVDLQPHPNPSVDIVIGDLVEPDVIAASLEGGIDAIVHLAAVTSVLRSVEQPELTHRTNVTATAALLEAARVAGVKTLVFTSTNAVVGPMEDPAISETSRLRPMTPYGATKAAAEMLMSAYTEVFGLRCVCLRLTNAYGPGMEAKDSIVARLMRAIRTGATFEIYGDGTQVRDYVHVSDIVAAMRLALTDDSWRGATVIGSGTSLSVLNVVEAVKKVSDDATLSVRHGPAKAGEMPAVIVDTSRARAAGWLPRYDLAGGLVGVWEEWSRADIAAPAGGGR
jgi:UDP-glucose 4-epimerase